MLFIPDMYFYKTIYKLKYNFRLRNIKFFLLLAPCSFTTKLIQHCCVPVFNLAKSLKNHQQQQYIHIKIVLKQIYI